MSVREWIVREVRRRGRLASGDVVRRFGVTRQTGAQHLRELVAGRRLLRIGTTRGAYYVPFSRSRAQPPPRFARRYALRGLQEDRVFQQAAGSMALSRHLSAEARRIAQYAFAEMLNNAIDHSRSLRAGVRLECRAGRFAFRVEDKGIGVFASVRRKFGLKDDADAAEHLLKGKQTTDPERHSGQGIFFTSKIADRFVLESGRLVLTVDNDVGDVFLGERRPLTGTRVSFEVRQRTRKSLKELFDRYSNDEFEFDRTRVVVRLAERGGSPVSRSEARRLLAGLEAFRRIVLDFRAVRALGQGFTDEVFRVFASAHPQIRIEPVNMGPAVAILVERARRGATLQ